MQTLGLPIYDCGTLLDTKNPETHARLEDKPTLRVMTYNIENLLDFNLPKKPDDRPKSPEKIREIFQIINDTDPDVAILQEVETIDVLRQNAELYAPGKYMPILVEGNDPRGIDVAFLLKKGLNVFVKVETFKDEKWNDPVEQRETSLFARDLPVLLLSKCQDCKPFLLVIGGHAKSKRSRRGDPESFVWRSAEFKEAARLVGVEFKKKYGPNIPIVYGADFNTNITGGAETGPEVKPLADVMVDSFDVLSTKLSPQDRVTHAGFKPGGVPALEQLDGLWVTPNLVPFVKQAWVYRYKNSDGQVRPLPQFYADRQRSPSDHYPAILDLDLRFLSMN